MDRFVILGQETNDKFLEISWPIVKWTYGDTIWQSFIFHGRCAEVRQAHFHRKTTAEFLEPEKTIPEIGLEPHLSDDQWDILTTESPRLRRRAQVPRWGKSMRWPWCDNSANDRHGWYMPYCASGSLVIFRICGRLPSSNLRNANFEPHFVHP